MAVGLLRGDEGPPRAVHDQQLSHNLLQCPTQTGLHSNLPQDAGNHGLLRAKLFLLFGQISQQKAHNQKVDREHEKTFGLEIGSLDPELRQVTLQEQPLHPVKEAELEGKALQPQQQDLGSSCGDGLPHAPSISRSGQDKDKEKEKGIGLAGGENRDQRRPDNVRGMNQEAKGRGRFFPAAQKQDNNHALGDIKRQQAISPEGVADLAGIHSYCDQGGNSQKNASGSQPSLDAAGFAGTDGSSLPPQKPMSQRLEWQWNSTRLFDAQDIMAGKQSRASPKAASAR